MSVMPSGSPCTASHRAATSTSGMALLSRATFSALTTWLSLPSMSSTTSSQLRSVSISMLSGMVSVWLTTIGSSRWIAFGSRSRPFLVRTVRHRSLGYHRQHAVHLRAEAVLDDEVAPYRRVDVVEICLVVALVDEGHRDGLALVS